MSSLSLTGYDSQQSQWIGCLNPHKKTKQDAETYLRDLHKANKICSPLFATLVPVKITFSDIFFPWTVHYAVGNKDIEGIPRYLRIVGACLFDLITLIFRLISLLPRGIYNCSQKLATKPAYPIKEILTIGKDKNLPLRVEYQHKSFDFALVPMNAIEVRNYFSAVKSKGITKVQMIEE